MRTTLLRFVLCVMLGLVSLLTAYAGEATPLKRKKKVVFIAGACSHGSGEHEYRAGCLLLARLLETSMPNRIQTLVFDQWPSSSDALQDADAIVLYMDGSGKHLILDHLEELDELMKKGVGLTCLHYALQVPVGKASTYLANWLGGYYESLWSVNPIWTPEMAQFPSHSVTRGVKPFVLTEEWYYHMRFKTPPSSIIPLVSAIPPDSVLHLSGAHRSNEFVRKERGQLQHLAWVTERKEGGRGFGLTAGHFHRNWKEDDLRKLTLNGIAWTAGLSIPAEGIQTPTPTEEELRENLEQKPCR